MDGESIDRSSSPTSLTNIRYNWTSRNGQRSFAWLAFLRWRMPLFSSLKSTTNKWERQDSNLRRKTSTDLQSVAFDHSATLPFPGRGPPFVASGEAASSWASEWTSHVPKRSDHLSFLPFPYHFKARLGASALLIESQALLLSEAASLPFSSLQQ